LDTAAHKFHNARLRSTREQASGRQATTPDTPRCSQTWRCFRARAWRPLQRQATDAGLLSETLRIAMSARSRRSRSARPGAPELQTRAALRASMSQLLWRRLRRNRLGASRTVAEGDFYRKLNMLDFYFPEQEESVSLSLLPSDPTSWARGPHHRWMLSAPGRGDQLSAT
jgi:hypothetical protein